MSAFFRNCDLKSRSSNNLPIGSPLVDLKARAIIIDTEEGVINSMLKSDIGGLFEKNNIIKDASGAGNNWAAGNKYFGPNKHD